MEFFLGWLFFSFMVGFAGNDRSIGFWGAFFVSLLLSPIIGLIIALCSKSNVTKEMEDTILKNSQEHTRVLQKMNETPPVDSSNKYIDDLFKLKSLYDSKLISLEEFEKEKEILNKNRDN